MKYIIVYLLVLLVLVISIVCYTCLYYVWLIERHKILAYCICSGMIGGILYCLRAVYLNYCVRNVWEPRWHVWYYLRALVSFIAGGVSYIFLKAGLLVLESDSKPDASHFAFYAFGFIAGMNVDKFIGKIEDFAQKTWGIEKSRSANASESDNNPQPNKPK